MKHKLDDIISYVTAVFCQYSSSFLWTTVKSQTKVGLKDSRTKGKQKDKKLL